MLSRPRAQAWKGDSRSLRIIRRCTKRPRLQPAALSRVPLSQAAFNQLVEKHIDLPGREQRSREELPLEGICLPQGCRGGEKVDLKKKDKERNSASQPKRV